jgi:DNA processing protein
VGANRDHLPGSAPRAAWGARLGGAPDTTVRTQKPPLGPPGGLGYPWAMESRTPEQLLGALDEVERKNAPPSLFLEGDASLLEGGRRVSVVGTRKPSPEGAIRAQALVKALVEHGIMVVSGLAAGVDTVAHRTTIDLGGRTIAVLGTGLDECFPAENRSLLDLIVRDHLAVSQFPPGTPARRTNFPQRNRTMALLSDATVIVEAGETSGTLHQGWEALRLGRPLFLMESLARAPKLSWPAEMIRYGAQVLSRSNLEVVLEAIPERPRGELAF